MAETYLTGDRNKRPLNVYSRYSLLQGTKAKCILKIINVNSLVDEADTKLGNSKTDIERKPLMCNDKFVMRIVFHFSDDRIASRVLS